MTEKHIHLATLSFESKILKSRITSLFWPFKKYHRCSGLWNASRVFETMSGNTLSEGLRSSSRWTERLSQSARGQWLRVLKMGRHVLLGTRKVIIKKSSVKGVERIFYLMIWILPERRARSAGVVQVYTARSRALAGEESGEHYSIVVTNYFTLFKACEQ